MRLSSPAKAVHTRITMSPCIQNLPAAGDSHGRQTTMTTTSVYGDIHFEIHWTVWKSLIYAK